MCFCGAAIAGIVINQWFIEKRARITGIAFGGIGWGSAIWVPVMGIMIALIGWRNGFLFIGIMNAAIGVMALLFIRSPQKIGQKPLGWEAQEEKLKTVKSEETKLISGLTFRDALKSPSYWLVIIGTFCAGFLIAGFKMFGPSFWMSNGMPQTESTIYLTIFGVVGAVMITIGGQICEKMKIKKYTVFVYVAYLIGIVCMVIWPNNQMAVLIILAVVFCGAAYPVTGALPSLIASFSFGQKEFAKIWAPIAGINTLGMGTTGLIVSAAVGATGSMNFAFTVFLFAAAIALALYLIAMHISPVLRYANKEQEGEKLG